MPEKENIEIRAFHASELTDLFAECASKEEREEVAARVRAAYDEVLAESEAKRDREE